MKTVAILFAREDSDYKDLPECDVYDIGRDAMTYAANLPVVAHPPCRLWGKLAHLSKAPIAEMECARFAVRQVQRCGGVLEHPLGSRLWKDMGLPAPLTSDDAGFTARVPQSIWGHRAEKETLLYVSGMQMDDMPKFTLIEFLFNQPTHVIATSKRSRAGGAKSVSMREREATPPRFAQYLISVAKLCRKL